MAKAKKIEKITLDQPEIELNKAVRESDVEDQTVNPSQEDKKGIVKEMSIKDSKPTAKNLFLNITISLMVVGFGIFSGWGLSQVVGSKSDVSPEEQAMVNKEEIKPGDVYGSELNGFRDTAEGVLLKGGLDGEGSHRILRPGGETQTVYLTSSVIDLNPFKGHKVKVWGETFAAQKVSWLMDVGRVEVIELDAEKPFEEDLE